MDFSYILDKIKNSEFSCEPFRHIEINNLFKDDDFNKIIKSPEIAMKEASSDDELIDILLSSGFDIINFFGGTTDKNAYIEWHKNKDKKTFVNLFLKNREDLYCPEGTLDRLSFLDVSNDDSGKVLPILTMNSVGMVFRLLREKSEEIKYLKDFISSDDWINCLADKFKVDMHDTTYDCGIQKYLDGYAMTPHPDLRHKSLTFLMNINPNPLSEWEEHHTQYHKFKSQWEYVKDIWDENPKLDRCWVPWDWCEKVKEQKSNNSIVIYMPDRDTLHSVKTNYNHLEYQRTQFYGNILHKETPATSRLEWQDLVRKEGFSSF